jgi:hypothetical protein
MDSWSDLAMGLNLSLEFPDFLDIISQGQLFPLL